MPEIEEFTRRMRVRARRIDENRHSLLRRTALAIDQAVVLATPVDEGRARANWVVSLNEPRTEEVTDYPKGEGGSSGAAAAAQAIAQGQKTITEADPDVRTIYISNNLPYIRRLNDGYSAQAPAGFVEEAVAAGVAAVRGAKLVGD